MLTLGLISMGSVSRSSLGVAACPSVYLSRKALRRAARRWVASGDDEGERKRRARVAKRLLKLVASIQRRLGAGQHAFRLARHSVVEGGRVVASASVLDNIVLRAIDDRCLGNPRLRLLFGGSYAIGGKGPQTAARAIRDAIIKLVEVHGEITVVTFDVHHAYRSASVDRALHWMAHFGCAREVIDALRAYYALLHTDGRFRGIQEGICTSSLIFDVAMLPFDAAARGGVQAYFRYSDNLFAILPGRVGIEDARHLFEGLAGEFLASEGWRPELHKWAIAHFNGDSSNETIDWLGFEFAGGEVQIPRARLERALEKARAAEPAMRQESVHGSLGNYVGVVAEHDLDRARRELHQILGIADGEAMPRLGRKRRAANRSPSPPLAQDQGSSAATKHRPGPRVAARNLTGGRATGPSSRRALSTCLGVEDCMRHPTSISGERLDDIAYLHRCGDIFNEFVPRRSIFIPPREPEELGELLYFHHRVNRSRERETVVGAREADLRVGLPLPEDCVGEVRYLLCGEHLRQAARMHLALAVCQCVVPGRIWEHDRRFLRTLGTVVVQQRFQIYGMACVAAVYANQPGARGLANRAALNLRPFRLPDNAASFLDSLAESAVIDGDQDAQMNSVRYLAASRGLAAPRPHLARSHPPRVNPGETAAAEPRRSAIGRAS